jgi:hypothetical protein
MKLKEWGLMRHKPRRTTKQRREAGLPREERAQGDDELSASAEPIPIESESSQHRTRTDGWPIIANLPTSVADEAVTAPEPTFPGLLNQPQQYATPSDNFSFTVHDY